jgi:hypothetical protein
MGFLRAAAVFLASVLGVVAVVLIVFSASQKQTQIGVLLGLWAALIGAFLAFGARRGTPDVEAVQRTLETKTAELRSAGLELFEQSQRDTEHELVRLGELQSARDAIARRESELRLELVLRREVERLLTDQIGFLRDEVASLRSELLDKLGGQLLVEHIETTRVSGDLAAIQNEIRRLAGHWESHLTASVERPRVIAIEAMAAADVRGLDETPAYRDTSATYRDETAAYKDETGGYRESAPAPARELKRVTAHIETPATPTGPATSTPDGHESVVSQADSLADLPRLSQIPDDVADVLLRDAPTAPPTPILPTPEPMAPVDPRRRAQATGPRGAVTPAETAKPAEATAPLAAVTPSDAVTPVGAASPRVLFAAAKPPHGYIGRRRAADGDEEDLGGPRRGRRRAPDPGDDSMSGRLGR